MDPHSFIARAEAQRWLGIAEKLLISHDLVGSKTFAIRARESDPRLEAADQILAIADTLLAAEKRVVGSNGSHQPDYYAILQLVRFVQDTEHITSQYRRLAVLLNPHQNRFPYSDQAFQLVNDAYAVLSNPMRKSMYDSDLDYPPQQQMNTLGFNLEQQHHQQQQQQQHHQQQQQQAHNFFSINHMSEQELPEQQQTFQSRLHQQQHQQLQQHNFLSQPNPVRPLPVREPEHMFQHREQEHLFQPQVQPFQVTSPPHQQNRPSPQPHIQSPPATPQPPFSWPQQSQSQFQQQIQHQQIKQEHQHQIKQEHQLKHEQQLQQQMKQEQQKQQLKQQQLQQEQLKQQQLQQQQEEQRKQQQLLEEQRKQQQMLEEQRKQQQLLEEQRKQQQLLEEQRKQQQLLEEQRKQQQLLEEQRKQQQQLEEQRKQQLLEEQRKQQQLLEEQRKQQQLQEEQRKQQQLLEEQRKQQQLLEEQRKQQQLLEEQRKQQLQEEQRKQHQLQEEQRKQQQLQEEQRKQQERQQESFKQNATPVQPPSQVNSNNGVRDEETETDAENEPVDDSPTFWTACPYCFYMYEYPRVYVECTLRCDNCKRAFQAVRISSPPPILEGQDAYFYCWGFFPLGLSMPDLQGNNNKGTNSNWTPFSSLHVTSNKEQNHLNEQAAPKANPFVNKSSGPRIYINDITDDVFIGFSEPSSDSDTEWVGDEKQKSKKMDKGFKERIQVLALRAMYTGNESAKNLKHGMQGGVEVPAVLVVETNKKNVGSNPSKQSGRVAKEMGKLDLNVEFSNNEGEETAQRMAAETRPREQGEEDNIEGVGFFEGLDEYLSSLPILSVVNEEKVTVA